MNQIIVASHSKLASGMADTITYFGGGAVEILEQTLTETGFETKVLEMLEKHKDKNCIVFTDLYGGSVNQVFFKNLTRFHFHLVTGMNLAVILECVFTHEEIDEQFIRKAIAASREQICYMNDIFSQTLNKNED